MRITGIGGTGVVTVAQVIGTAAMLDGFDVNGLDQIGLSQKAGPVVSDVRLSKLGPGHTNRLGSEQADLLLVCDQLVAVSDAGRLVCSPDRTAVVGSSTPTPTGEMITHPDLRPPTHGSLESLIATDTRPDAQYWADTGAITTALFGDAVLSNMFVVGMAVQSGCLPVSVSAIEEAIELNGIAVEKNLLAFAWGRAQVALPDEVAAATSAEPATRLGHDEPAQSDPLDPSLLARISDLSGREDLQATLERLTRDLVGFQDHKTAEQFVATLEAVDRGESQLASDQRLTEAVAIHLHKLTAYKDEYEVARLMLLDDGLADAKALANGGTITWKLHPPMLRGLGMDRKISITSKAAPAFRSLAAGKRLRGTRLDPFGRAAVRRLERELVTEYRDVVDQLVAGLTAENLPVAIEIASLPDQVRGYEDLKVRRAGEYRAELARALDEFRSRR